jgi:hypothetical protein
MLVRKIKGNTETVLSFFMVLFACCMVFCGVLYAAPVEEPTATTEVTGSGEVVDETPAAQTASPGQAEGATADVVAKDAATLRKEEIKKKNEKCLMCHKRDKTKLLEDGTEMSLQVPKEPYFASAHGTVSCVSCHREIR